MRKRTITLLLLVLLGLLQYPLWFGKGGLFRAWELERSLAAQRQTNRELHLRNQQLEGEVKNLREGVDAIEERARYELGMTKADEIYVQVVKPKAVEVADKAAQTKVAP
jgi:cell division protein FtsB